jgi:hypothetical protein
MTPQPKRPDRPAAIGLVHVTAGIRSPDRWWYRALVIRHARDHGLQLVDILELDDDGQRNGYVLTRLAALAAQSRARALVSYGVEPQLAATLAADLGVQHLPVPHTDRPQQPPSQQEG